MKKIESNDQTLSSYLRIDSTVGVLNVPFSQRPYEWEKAQVVRLFNDLIGLIDNSDAIHMLNFFTLSNEGEIKKIFDGQQRTISSLLIISAFARKLRELKEVDAAAYLVNSYIISKNPLKNSEYKKLIFENQETNQLFYDLLEENNLSDMNSKNYSDTSQKNLITNYKFINQLVDTYVEENDLDGIKLKGAIDKILDRTQLITITTATDDLAMAMFETLNNTGKKLENFYVLKNDLVLSLTEERVKDKWKIIESNLGNFDPSSFLLCVATCLTGKSSKENSLERIYRVKRLKENDKDMEEFLNLLEVASEKYLYIKNPAQFISYRQKQDLSLFKKMIENVHLFINTQHHPLILAMMLKNEPLNELNKVLKALLNLGIRNFYFKENRANTIETPIANLANKYYLNELTITEVKNNLISLAIKDDEFKEAIIAKKIKKVAEKQFKFILRETYNTIDLDKETQITETLSGIHLEHILPQNPDKNSEWLKIYSDDEDREFFTRKVGNMTLLLGKINMSISNKDFVVKKKQYSLSHIPENNHNISNCEKWEKEEINSRTESLSNKIIQYTHSLI